MRFPFPDVCRSLLTIGLRRGRPLIASALLASALSLLVGAPLALTVATASASTTDELRGEWEIELKCECTFPDVGTNYLRGSALITKMNQATGEFLGTTDFDGFPGEITEDTITKERPRVTENKLWMLLQNGSPLGEFYFVVSEGVVAEGGNKMSGPGVFDPGAPQYEHQGSFTAVKIRSWAQIEKEEEEKRIKAEKEKFEREGREIGEREGREKGEAAGREKGEKEGREKAEAEVKAKDQQEAAERQAKEAQAASERQAREKSEKEAAEKAEAQARDKAEQEAREKVAKEAAAAKEKEAKERKAREARERWEKEAKHKRTSKRTKRKSPKKPVHKASVRAKRASRRRTG